MSHLSIVWSASTQHNSKTAKTMMASSDHHDMSTHESDVSTVMQTTRTVWLSQTADALKSAEDSQATLNRQLDALQRDMENAATVLSTAGVVGGATSRAINETQECLLRSRRKLATIRARVGRLRSLEQADRLSLTQDEPSIHR